MNMKIFAPLVLLAGLMAGCTATSQSRSITAQVDGGAGKTLYLDKFVSNQPVHVDSVLLDKEGKGVMKVPSMPLDFYSINFDGKNMLVVLLDSAENLVFEAKTDSLQQPKLVEGSVNTSLMHAYFKESMAFDKENQPLMERLKADRNDSAAMQRYMELNNAFTARSKDFINTHMSSPAVLAALNRMNIQQDLPLFMAVRDSLRKTIPNSEYFAGFRDEVDRMEQQAKAGQLQEEQQAKLDNLIPVGSEAPDFSQASPEGKQIALSDLRGKVVLIDFWASWCRPCRMENPNVKKVYDRFHNKGFEILGVSLDKDKSAWTGAIKQDGLPWKHVSDLAFWNNAVAQQYGVSSIPYTVLVDRDGKVLAKNLRGPALEAKLAEIFK
ncbi:MAG: AhpC/TSA family protein [Flavobacteriales bacterium]|jgi:peroxiredoxin|nr:AhpC/TSA family protein [Flavobacteriales bacterium]MBK6892629.1 AhpC/TSA family protein [Flavobacteriales bacterium]MBK7246768.1 AhpC/TSA family protein [Flavobacteriales bacterium]MBK9061116.1 AhpC/TSA family protein [Flavobacteriales bacterium]QQS72443.1 MAG: AhpC/TSA family protein [Flavobacteriales bacterium]